MRRFYLVPILAVALCAAPPARAEVTAPEVYAALQDLARALDGTPSAEQFPGADRIVLRQLAFTHSTGLKISFGPLTLGETSDGAVLMTLPDRFDLIVQPTRRFNPAAARQVVFSVAMPGFQARIGALEPADTRFDLQASSVSVTLDRIEPALAAGQSLDVAVAAADLALSWHQALRGSAGSGQAVLTLGTLHGDLTYAVPADQGGITSGDLAADLAGLTSDFVFLLPDATGADPGADPGRDIAVLLEMLDKGAFIRLSATTGAVSASGNVTEPGGTPITLAAAVGGARGALDFDRDRLEYLTWLGPGSLRMQGDFPDPAVRDMGLAWQVYRTRLTLGIGTLVDTQPWSFGFELGGLAFSDPLWAAIDPKAALSHDPATAVLDLSGSFALDPVVLTPQGRRAPGEDLPFRALSLALDKVLLAALGVEITATGALEFDFSAVRSPADDPIPSGNLGFVTRGASALIDRLAAGALISADQVSSLRMGLLFLGRAGTAPDTLETRMEFREGGFWLNGQKIR